MTGLEVRIRPLRESAEVVAWRRSVAYSDLTGTQKGVAQALAMYFSAVGCVAWPSVEQLASDAAFGRSATSAALRVLEQRGFVERVAPVGHRPAAWRAVPQ